ncbi:hypothetical protein AVI51_15975 (plasmid) [Piscirickettsia salmonis]|uniref:protein kinase domain-containing protein n=1 Tax=Piscirickettsia salmonis TaxID=1238 RepID=UPI00094A2BCC|nr:serine/threonine-protein kinase [Piscirickettsia salmonis]APS55602.1 hypothetical protein AVI51_15975 [Piscirickettsia salmonis]
MNKLNWITDEDRKKEWEIAKKNLKYGIASEGTKLKRSTKLNLSHSFIVINQKIYALAGEEEILGQGKFGKVKLVEDEQRNLYVIKVSYKDKFKAQELKILDDLGLLQGQTQRNNKHYLLLNFLGNSLDKVEFKDDRGRLDACFQLIHLVNKLNKGELSKFNHPYYHNDIKPNNAVLNEQGQVSLIDFGLASRLKKPEFIEGYKGFHAPEILTQGYSPESDTYSLGITLKKLLPHDSRLHHTAQFMSSYYPENRPSKDVAEVDFLVELYKHSDEKLTKALLNNNCITKDVNEAKAITALLEGSTAKNNLVTVANIDLIKSNKQFVIALVMAHNYLNSGRPGWKRTYADHAKDFTQRFIQSLIFNRDKSSNSIQCQIQEWIKSPKLTQLYLQEIDNKSIDMPGSHFSQLSLTDQSSQSGLTDQSSHSPKGYFAQSGLTDQSSHSPKGYFAQSGLTDQSSHSPKGYFAQSGLTDQSSHSPKGYFAQSGLTDQSSHSPKGYFAQSELDSQDSVLFFDNRRNKVGLYTEQHNQDLCIDSKI